MRGGEKSSRFVWRFRRSISIRIQSRCKRDAHRLNGGESNYFIILISLKACASVKFFWKFRRVRPSTLPESVVHSLFRRWEAAFHSAGRRRQEFSMELHRDRRERCVHGGRRRRERVKTERRGGGGLVPELSFPLKINPRGLQIAVRLTCGQLPPRARIPRMPLLRNYAGSNERWTAARLAKRDEGGRAGKRSRGTLGFRAGDDAARLKERERKNERDEVSRTRFAPRGTAGTFSN